VSVLSATSAIAVAPAGSGTVDVIFTNADGQSATLSMAFTYFAAPSINGMSPGVGPVPPIHPPEPPEQENAGQPAQESKEAQAAFRKADEIYDTILKVFAIAKSDKVPSYLAADRLAEQRIRDVGSMVRTWPQWPNK
jgi:hypothetical protein